MIRRIVWILLACTLVVGVRFIAAAYALPLSVELAIDAAVLLAGVTATALASAMRLRARPPGAWYALAFVPPMASGLLFAIPMIVAITAGDRRFPMWLMWTIAGAHNVAFAAGLLVAFIVRRRRRAV